MKDEYVSLIPTPVVNNTIQWTMIHNGNYGQGGKYPNVDLSGDGQHSKIYFKIVDLYDTKITFDSTVVDSNSTPDAINGIWIAKGSGAQKNKGQYPDQINQVKLQDANTTLIVGDKNSNDDVLTYRLNFKEPPGLTVPIIDPEIRNGGGGGYYFNMETAALVLGLVTLLLVGSLWFSHFRSRR